MNVLILGGTSGFGADIGAHIAKPHNQLVYPINKLVTLGKRDVDFTDGAWVPALRQRIADEFGGPSAVTAIVLAAYDRTNQQDNMQLRVANTLYEIYRKSTTHLMFIGDIRHHMGRPDSMYLANKRDLWLTSMKMAVDPLRRAPITLYEPYHTGYESVSEMGMRVASGVPGEFYCVSHYMRYPIRNAERAST